MLTLSLRIDLGPDRRIGPGKIELLERIAATGSISAAARSMEMSYKRAWDLVEETNKLLGKPVVAAQTGGKQGGGAKLTAFGHSIVTRFRAIELAAITAATVQLTALQDDIAEA
ncbi:MAG: winged helix-turn-helix domain-containing protein [Hyphomicrobiales bacterium]|nr:winged helix-turn-helix domain-containing protein [Hyphomicrobiales bacterium]